MNSRESDPYILDKIIDVQGRELAGLKNTKQNKTKNLTSYALCIIWELYTVRKIIHLKYKFNWTACIFFKGLFI